MVHMGGFYNRICYLRRSTTSNPLGCTRWMMPPPWYIYKERLEGDSVGPDRCASPCSGSIRYSIFPPLYPSFVFNGTDLWGCLILWSFLWLFFSPIFARGLWRIFVGGRVKVSPQSVITHQLGCSLALHAFSFCTCSIFLWPKAGFFITPLRFGTKTLILFVQTIETHTG